MWVAASRIYGLMSVTSGCLGFLALGEKDFLSAFSGMHSLGLQMSMLAAVGLVGRQKRRRKARRKGLRRKRRALQGCNWGSI